MDNDMFFFWFYLDIEKEYCPDNGESYGKLIGT